MSTDARRPPEERVIRPAGICLVRSEPLDHTRLYSVTTSLDVLQTSARHSHRSTDIDEVLRIVARFLHESSR